MKNELGNRSHFFALIQKPIQELKMAGPIWILINFSWMDKKIGELTILKLDLSQLWDVKLIFFDLVEQYYCWSRRDFNETKNLKNQITAPEFSINDNQMLETFSTSFEFNGTHARCHYKQDQEWETRWYNVNTSGEIPCSTNTLPVATFIWSPIGNSRYKSIVSLP